MMRAFGWMAPALLLAASCATVPFDREPDADYRGLDPEAIAASFRARIPPNVEILESVVVRAWGRDIAALGLLAVDEASGRVVLSGMNPAGVQLFLLEHDGVTARGVMRLPIPGDTERMMAAMAEDVRRLHADWVPPDNAIATVHANRIIMRAHGDDDRRVDYIFRGAGQHLAEKHYYEKGKRVARVRYYNYQPHGAYFYPGGMVLENHVYGYRLTVRLRELHLPPAEKT